MEWNGGWGETSRRWKCEKVGKLTTPDTAVVRLSAHVSPSCGLVKKNTRLYRADGVDGLPEMERS